MKWRKILGAFLLLITLVLIILLSVKVPFIRTNHLFDNQQITVSSNGEPENLNVTLEPYNKSDYNVEVTLSPYYQMDFWAVNATGLDMLAYSLSFGETLRSEYPNKPPFNSIKTYAKGINITHTTSFELTNVTSDGVYCLAFINFYDSPQNVSVTVEERYLESVHTILEPNPVNVVVTVLIFAVGTYFLLMKRKQPHRRAKRPPTV
jgi:hypothetical protein